MKLAYYPGCSAQSTCRELGASMRRVAPRLDLELVTL
jgi:succinate dehydrogenase / fumarate reductase cytochrome b subunit